MGENNGSIVYRHNKTELDNYLNLGIWTDYYIESQIYWIRYWVVPY